MDASRNNLPLSGSGTLSQGVYKLLSERLMAGEHQPGEKLSLRNVGEALGVSTTPVREAINKLVADGALEVTPNRAVRVPVMTRTQFQELTEVRIMIEGGAAARAARLRKARDLAAMEKLSTDLCTEADLANSDPSSAIA